MSRAISRLHCFPFNCCLIQDEIVFILAPLVKMWVSLSKYFIGLSLINSNKLLHSLRAAETIEWEQTPCRYFNACVECIMDVF